MIVSDGVFEYMTEEEVRSLLNSVTDHFPTGQIAFDVMNSYAIRSGRERLERRTGAAHKWAVDDVRAVDMLDTRLRRISNQPVLTLKYLPLKYRLLFGTASVLPRVRNMIRLLRYEFRQD